MILWFDHSMNITGYVIMGSMIDHCFFKAPKISLNSDE